MTVDTQYNISPILGTSQDDILTGTGRSEVISGAGGDDVIAGLSGNDEIFGGTGNDEIMGQSGDDTIYGNGRPSYVDLTQLLMVQQTQATVTFVDEGAGYKNALGVYEIDENGDFFDVQILFPNASKVGSGGDLIPNQSQITFDVNEGSQLGFFVVSNGYSKSSTNQQVLASLSGAFELRTDTGDIGNINGGPVTLWHINGLTGEEVHVKSQYGYDLFHSLADPDNNYQLNPDNYLHVVGRAFSVTGDLLIGFEDLYGGGDNDYDDTIINIHLGQQNIVAQLPVSTHSGPPKSDDDILYGGSGDDTIHGIGGDDLIYGDTGDDSLFGNSGDDVIHGNNGRDELSGNSGDDILRGGSGEDLLYGNSGNDELYGDGGNDELYGNSGADWLDGGGGSDIINAGSGNDTLLGGNGNDTLNGNSGADILYGGFGSDVLNGHSGDDLMFGENSQDRLVGGGGDDILFGGDHKDKLYGGSDADQLFGESGADYLNGGSGNDILDGGTGKDKLLGGSGEDLFVISEYEAGDSDIIGDFGTGDTVDVTWFNLGTWQNLIDTAEQIGSHLYFDLTDNYTLRINNHTIGDMHEDDFFI